MSIAGEHRTVLLEEAVQALAIKPDGIYVDGTFGRGGHSALILSKLGSAGRLIGLDRDPQAVAVGKSWSDARFTMCHARFSDMLPVLAGVGVTEVDGILLDLGVSSPQIDQAERGFSFRHNGPLDMRMDPTQGMSAAQWLQTASETDIAEVLKNYGEERAAFPIAKAIVARRIESIGRGSAAFETTGELADLVAGVIRRVSRGKGNRASLGKDPATRVFQALRIFVNQELEELARVLGESFNVLRPEGRLAVISFHSLEDRIVKQFFARESGKAQWEPAANTRGQSHRTGTASVMQSHEVQARFEVMKKIAPSDAETSGNPRARSAILRSAMRLPLRSQKGIAGAAT